jgi:hypothetical protein
VTSRVVILGLIDVPITKCLMTLGEIGTIKLHKVKISLLEMAVPVTMETETILIGREMGGTDFKVRNDFNSGVLSTSRVQLDLLVRSVRWTQSTDSVPLFLYFNLKKSHFLQTMISIQKIFFGTNYIKNCNF